MSGKAIAIVVVAAVLLVGGQQAYVAFANRNPLKTTCANYVNSKSSAKWVELSGCDIDYRRAIQLQSRIIKEDKGIFVPVRPIGSTAAAPILLHLQKDDFDRRLETFISAPLLRKVKEGEMITGLVQFGMDSDLRVNEAIGESKLKTQLSADYKLIESGAKPDIAAGFFGIAMIVVAVVVALLLLRGRAARTAIPPPLPTIPPPNQ